MSSCSPFFNSIFASQKTHAQGRLPSVIFAIIHVSPLSEETSTRATFRPPPHIAKPCTRIFLFGIVLPSRGEVITQFTESSLNCKPDFQSTVSALACGGNNWYA